MTEARSLAGLLVESARRFPDREAVVEPDGRRITYAQLDSLSDRFRDRLLHLGVRSGDRVGLRLRKSIDAVAAIFGILKSGAAYVPVDAESPVDRGAFILHDCEVRAVLTEVRLEEAMTESLRQLGGAMPIVLALDDLTDESALGAMLERLQRSDPAPRAESRIPLASHLAYILYTSGSTGKPKGVSLTHGNALSFVDWCSEVFEPHHEDRFSSHAPFHFDLSILDLYVSLKHGACLVLIGEALGKDPLRLASVIGAEAITIWYSTPSILSLLANYGKLERFEFHALRLVFFAGEVFPIPQYQAIRRAWPVPRFVNLYGPTETNVCTWFEVPDDAAVAKLPTFPIGRMCEPNVGMVVDEQDALVTPGTTGELLVSGPNVMTGYWGMPERTADVFRVDEAGRRWYRTGDIVTEDPTAGYRYVGRRDRMVKRRGYRVELGEIEVGLLRHPDVREAAVIAVPDPDSGVRVLAFVCHSAVGAPLTRIALKSHSARVLPPYMIPDVFHLVEALPRTSTDKIDYQALRNRAAGGPSV